MLAMFTHSVTLSVRRRSHAQKVRAPLSLELGCRGVHSKAAVVRTTDPLPPSQPDLRPGGLLHRQMKKLEIPASPMTGHWEEAELPGVLQGLGEVSTDDSIWAKMSPVVPGQAAGPLCQKRLK